MYLNEMFRDGNDKMNETCCLDDILSIVQFSGTSRKLCSNYCFNS